MHIRNGTYQDLDAVTTLESVCFPPAEGASRQSFSNRLQVYPNHFWLLEDNGILLAMADGLVSDEDTIRDNMYAQAALHNPEGAWQTVLGLGVHPAYRRRGFAGQVLRQVIANAKEQGRRGVILACKGTLTKFYTGFGFHTQGISQSVHGGAVWYDMRLTF